MAAVCSNASWRTLVVGDLGAVRAAAKGRGIDPARVVRIDDPVRAWAVPRGRVPLWQPTADLPVRDRRPGRPTSRSGAAQLAWIDAGCDLVKSGAADALVTGPVSKEAIVRSGAPGSRGFSGHTEYLQKRLRASEVVMAFWSPSLVTSLATTHLPLARVPRVLSAERVARAIYWLAWLLTGLAPGAAVRVAVAALNPHAGEGGLLGDDEARRILPGIGLARTRLRRSQLRAEVDGPIAAETVFRLALAGQWDGVVAMYHDQATIPMKLAQFGDAVNVSLGLPIVRTSVDHGTAYDRAGRWDADARGMAAAIRLALRLATSEMRRPRSNGARASALALTGARRGSTRAKRGETSISPQRSA